MMAEYPTPPGDGMAPIVDEFRKLGRRISELERPSGTNIGSLVAQVQAKLVDLNAAVIAEVDSYLSSGTVNVTNLTASGTLTASGALKSAGAAGTDLGTIPGNRRSAWQIYDGANIGLYGYSTSSIETKMNLEKVSYTPGQFLACIGFLYEYRGQVAIRDDPENEYYDPAYKVPEEVGYMAEHLIANGLEQFVTMFQGEPIGIDYAAFAAIGMTVIGREHENRIASLEARLEKLEP
jgi:hypothetical protein